MSRRKDPKFVDYFPATCDEAIELFYKMRDNGHIVWDDIDRSLQQCAKKLNKEEYDLFLNWVLNPTQIKKSDLVPDIFPASGLLPRETSDQDDEKSSKHPA